MDAARLLRQWVLVEHVTAEGPPDGMGDPTEVSTWSRFRGYAWQENVTELTGNTNSNTEQWRLGLVRSAAGHIDAGDRVIVGGRLDGPDGKTGIPVPDVGEPFEVSGEPWPARNPRTQLVEYVECKLDRSA